MVATPLRRVREGWKEAALAVAAAEEDPDEAAWRSFGNEVTMSWSGDQGRSLAGFARPDGRNRDPQDQTVPDDIPDGINRILRRVIVAPMTSGSHPAPFRVATAFQGKPGLVLLDKIRTLDKVRLVKRLGRVEADVLAAVLDVLGQMFAE